MMRKLWKLIVTLSAACMLACAQKVYAEDNASLTAVLRYHETPVAHEEVRIYQIADAEIPSLVYTVDSKWNTTAEELSRISSASENEKTAEKLLAYIREKNIKADQSKKTDSDGSVTFTGLKQGLYLLDADGKDGYEIIPALINIPMRNTDTDEWNYQVTVYPKTSYTPVEKPSPSPDIPEKSELVDTGDQGTGRYACMLVISIALAAFAAGHMHAGK